MNKLSTRQLLICTFIALAMLVLRVWPDSPDDALRNTAPTDEKSWPEP